MTRTASGSPEWLFLQRFPHCALSSPLSQGSSQQGWPPLCMKFLRHQVGPSSRKHLFTGGSPQFRSPYALGCLWKACSSPEKGEAERYFYGREGERQSVGSCGRAGQSQGKVRSRVSGKTPKQPHSLVRAGLATCPLNSLLPFSFS